MNLFEGLKNNVEKTERSAEYFAEAFSKLERSGEKNREVLFSFEEVLRESGFDLTETNEVSEIFRNPQLKCRSESIENVANILGQEVDLVIENPEDDANMCVMAGGEGFRRAVLEGFSERSTKGRVKIVLTFDSIDSLTNKDKLSPKPIPRDSERFRTLWDSRPETARVSLRGSGSVALDDIKMISLRLPVEYFPGIMDEDELEEMKEAKIPYTTRHYIRKESEKNRTIRH